MLKIKKIDRENYSWGVFDEDKKEFVKVFETKAEAKEYLKKTK